MVSNLTDKQERFVEEYLVDLNATQAAIRAGYSEKTAAVIGFQNLTKLNIAEAIQVKRQEISEETGITIKRVLEEEATLAFLDIADLFDENGFLIKKMSEIPEETRRAIAGLEVIVSDVGLETRYKFKLNDKGKALERLGRHLGMYNDTLTVINKGNLEEKQRAAEERVNGGSG